MLIKALQEEVDQRNPTSRMKSVRWQLRHCRGQAILLPRLWLQMVLLVVLLLLLQHECQLIMLLPHPLPTLWLVLLARQLLLPLLCSAWHLCTRQVLLLCGAFPSKTE